VKIEPGGIYRHKVRKSKVVIVDRIEGRRVYFAPRGLPGQPSSSSIRDFAIKYEELKRDK